MSKLPKSALSLKQVQTHDLMVLTINKMCQRTSTSTLCALLFSVYAKTRSIETVQRNIQDH